MNHERLWTLGNKLKASKGRQVGDWDRPVMGVKEDTYCMVHWVLYARNESQNFTSQTNDIIKKNKPILSSKEKKNKY